MKAVSGKTEDQIGYEIYEILRAALKKNTSNTMLQAKIEKNNPAGFDGILTLVVCDYNN